MANEINLSEEAQARAARQWKRRVRLIMYFGGGVLVLLAGVLLLTFLLGRNDSPGHNARSGTAANGTSDNNINSETAGNRTSNNVTTQLAWEHYVLTLLPEHTLEAMRLDPSSPQAMSYNWLVNDTLLSVENMDVWRIQQRFALAAFYYATSGEQWITQTNWLDHNISECKWYSRPVFQPGNDSYVFYNAAYEGKENTDACNADGAYEHLWLYSNLLVGSLPLELYMLTRLKSISLSTNSISGTVSPLIANLVDLEALWINNNGIGGSLPSEVGHLTKMTSLSLVSSMPTVPFSFIFRN